MHYDHDADELVFSSGRRLYAHGGTIGISPDLELGQGADGSIDLSRVWNDENYRLTLADALELCDHMIGRWQKFKGTLMVGDIKYGDSVSKAKEAAGE